MQNELLCPRLCVYIRYRHYFILLSLPLGQLCSPHLSPVRVFRAAFIARGSRPAQQCLGQWPPHGRRGGQHSTNTVVDFLSLHHVSVCAYVRVHVCCMYVCVCVCVCVLYNTADRVHFFCGDSIT